MDISSTTTSSAPVSQTAITNPNSADSSAGDDVNAYKPPPPPPLPPGQGVRVDQLA